MFTRLYRVCTQSSREGADYIHWDPSPLGSTRRQLTLVNIFTIYLCVYQPSFICILIILFVLICTGSFVNKIVLQHKGTPKYLGESVTGMKMGLEMKQQHYVFSVKMVNLAWMLAGMQMTISRSPAHAQWFFCQNDRADYRDVI